MNRCLDVYICQVFIFHLTDFPVNITIPVQPIYSFDPFPPKTTISSYENISRNVEFNSGAIQGFLQVF